MEEHRIKTHKGISPHCSFTVMGKGDNEQSLPSTTLDAQGTNPSSRNNSGCCLGCSRVQKLVSFKCVFVLVLGVGVLLSALFWLPFFHSGDRKDLDLDYEGRDIVASFMLKKPASFLQDNILGLENAIFDEMRFSNTRVEIISLESPAGLNTTKVVFAVQSDSTTRSLIRELFEFLITRQSILRFSASLFGDPYSFDVLKFRGGITASPEQNAFLMQSVQIIFNFSLNFSIDQNLENFDELSSQLKTGLHLVPYENLYIELTNLRGSTVDPPTTVQAQVFLAVGINPSRSRFKQLAQTINDSHSKNLGLNNTVFGRVKQVRLSSISQHSLGPSPSPLSSPSPSQSHHHYPNLAPRISPSPSPSIGKGGYVVGNGAQTPGPVPATAPAPAPAPGDNKAAEPPACHFGYSNRFPWINNNPRGAPSVPLVYSPHAAPSQPRQRDVPPPRISLTPAESPLPNVAHAHSQPPSKGEFHARSPDVMPLVSPSPSPSSAGIFSSNILALPLFTLLVLHL